MKITLVTDRVAVVSANVLYFINLALNTDVEKNKKEDRKIVARFAKRPRQIDNEYASELMAAYSKDELLKKKVKTECNRAQ
ncbi:MAG: hypothetical protein IH840_15295 [Candidatus Heimdallarchaeota archaeon]|nr:hypothetical protein [Candidatus Heimdallarchaeota archaeon]